MPEGAKPVFLLSLAAALCLSPTAPAAAQAPPPIPDNAGFSGLDIRARQLVAWLNGDLPTEIYFSDYFLGHISVSQMEELRADIIAQHGRAISVVSIEPEEDIAATVHVQFADSVGSFDIVMATDGPQRLIGFLLTGFSHPGDSYAAIDREFAALSGHAGYAVAEIGATGPSFLQVANPERQFAIGSAFKLYVLAELAARVREGNAAWADVVQLTHRSIPSGIMQDWPANMPVTFASLATAMISLSDNSAADTLIHRLGRDQIGARLAKIGHGDPNRALPFLTTMEAFALKMESNDAVRQRFLSMTEAKQADFITAFGAGIERRMIRDVELTDEPVHIDDIEWFASPADMIGLLSYLQRLDDPLMRDMMAVNPGIGKNDAARWTYLGYKGGSEPGVINMSFLGQRPDGRWMAVTGSWNDEDAPVDEAAFASLMTRLLNLAVE